MRGPALHGDAFGWDRRAGQLPQIDCTVAAVFRREGVELFGGRSGGVDPVRGRSIRDGGPAKLVGCIFQNLLHAAEPAEANAGAARRQSSAVCHSQDQTTGTAGLACFAGTTCATIDRHDAGSFTAATGFHAAGGTAAADAAPIGTAEGFEAGAFASRPAPGRRLSPAVEGGDGTIGQAGRAASSRADYF